jgi:hypothetical protein
LEAVLLPVICGRRVPSRSSRFDASSSSRAGQCSSRWLARSAKPGPTPLRASADRGSVRRAAPNPSHRSASRGDRQAALDGSSPAGIDATQTGFLLTPRARRSVAVLAPPIDGDHAALLALLSDGEAWSTSALALALGASQRNVQRALAALEANAAVRSIGRARARRWLAPPLAGFTTTLLLPATLPLG